MSQSDRIKQIQLDTSPLVSFSLMLVLSHASKQVNELCMWTVYLTVYAQGLKNTWSMQLDPYLNQKLD